MKTDLSRFDNRWYRPGPLWKRGLWYVCNIVFFKNPMFPLSGLKCAILRLFGAKVGRGVVIKPSVNIKYPWKLRIGDYTWVGEGVWIDNLDSVVIGAHCCLSQGALILSGNHNYKKPAFDLLLRPIVLEDGVWIGAKSIVTQGVICHSHSMLVSGSVASSSLEANGIYRGNPAVKVKDRVISGE
jgi:putative colanic acid biosynthesis acetyltransferase WcaF